MFERLRKKTPKPDKGESTTTIASIIRGKCMEPIFEDNSMIYEDGVVDTKYPEVGDIGVVMYKNSQGETKGRMGIWGPIEETTGRRLIVTTQKGDGHGPIQGIEEDQFVKMKVIRTMEERVLKKLLASIRGIK